MIRRLHRIGRMRVLVVADAAAIAAIFSTTITPWAFLVFAVTYTVAAVARTVVSSHALGSSTAMVYLSRHPDGPVVPLVDSEAATVTGHHRRAAAGPRIVLATIAATVVVVATGIVPKALVVMVVAVAVLPITIIWWAHHQAWITGWCEAVNQWRQA